MDQRWTQLRELAERHRLSPFPDCRGEDVDGVDLVLVDADLHGSVSHFLDQPFKTNEFQLGILRSVMADLDRIIADLPDDWAPYFQEAGDLAHSLLECVLRDQMD